MTRKVYHRWLGLLLGVLMAGILGELGVRLFPTWHDAFVADIVHSQLPTDLYKPVGGFAPGQQPQKIRFVHHPNRQARFKGREYDNWVYTDEHGFRVSRSDTVEVKGRRILLLGDSFLFAGQVAWAESFVGRLNREFTDITWWNAGVDGYSTENTLALWEEQNTISPTEVWLFFFWGNDIWENDWATRPILAPSESLEVSWESEKGWLQWVQYSKLLSRLYALWSISNDERFIEKKMQMAQLRDLVQLNQALDSTEIQLQRMAKQCQQRSLQRCRVWLIPPMEAFYEDGLANQVVEQLQKRIPETLEVVDVYPWLQQSGGSALYFQSDPHWNIKGHQVVFESIREELGR